MKKIFYLTLALFVSFSINSVANTATPTDKVNAENADFISGPKKTLSNYAFFRLDNFNKRVYLAFYGAAHKMGDQLQIEITDLSIEQVVQVEYMSAHGGGTAEHFSLEGLDPGHYKIEVKGNIYNLNQNFVLD